MKDDKLPTISVIIPTLNAERPLSECLERIVTQDYPKNKSGGIITRYLLSSA